MIFSEGFNTDTEFFVRASTKHILKMAHSKKSTFLKMHILKMTHSKKSTFQRGHIPERKNFEKGIACLLGHHQSTMSGYQSNLELAILKSKIIFLPTNMHTTVLATRRWQYHTSIKETVCGFVSSLRSLKRDREMGKTY